MLSYWFPPSGGAGTQRIAKACKYLPTYGWCPLVLSSTPSPDAHAPTLDTSLLSDTSGVEVVRVPHGRVGLRRRLFDGLRFRLDMDGWVDRALPVALSLARNRRPRAVLTSLSPFSGWRIGAAVQRSLGVPWVLDLRDPWALDGWRSWPTPLHLAWDIHRMTHALRQADVVLANTPEAAKEYLRLGVHEHRLAVLPNGFDEEDCARSEGAPPPSDRFTLLHVGTLHSASGPPGLSRNGPLSWRMRQVARLARSGHHLFQAIALLRSRSPELADRLNVRLVGHVDPSHHDLARTLGIESNLTFRGYVDHQEALREIASANALFVPLHGTPPGERALVVPAKLYEALSSGKPLLAALPAGDGADLVQLLRAGSLVDPCDAEAMARTLGEWVGNPETARSDESRRGALAPFGRRRLAKALGQVLDRAVKGSTLADMVDPWSRARSLAAAQGALD